MRWANGRLHNVRRSGVCDLTDFPICLLCNSARHLWRGRSCDSSHLNQDLEIASPAKGKASLYSRQWIQPVSDVGKLTDFSRHNQAYMPLVPTYGDMVHGASSPNAAIILNQSEETITRWAQRGVLPVHRIQNQYLFNRAELQEWAALHSHQVVPELVAPSGVNGEFPSLTAAIDRGGICYRVPGGSRNAVLEAVTHLPGIPPGVNRPNLHQLLVHREALASTGMGNGIAIPHPRDPLVVRIQQPCVMLCFLAQAVDFCAIDGQPVRVLFMVLSPSVRVHLQILARLAFVLHDDVLKELLGEVASREAILERIRAIEASSAAATSVQVGAPPEMPDANEIR